MGKPLIRIRYRDSIICSALNKNYTKLKNKGNEGNKTVSVNHKPVIANAIIEANERNRKQLSGKI